MPIERVETRSIHAENVVVNNYYYPEPQQTGPTGGQPPRFTGPPLGLSSSMPGVSQKSRVIALILCFFFGFLGVHRFYVGRYLLGVVYVFTFGVLGIGWLVDLLLILFGKMRDGDRLPVSNW